MLLITILLFAATLASSIAALYQAHSSKQSAAAATEAVRLAEDSRDDQTISQGDTLIQMKSQNSAIRRSAEAASKAANTADNALKLAKESSKIEQRAWLAPIDITPPEYMVNGHPAYLKEGERSTIGVITTNSGRTPARFVMRVTARSLPRSAPFRPVVPRPDNIDSFLFALPNARVTSRIRIPDVGTATSAEIATITDRIGVLYLYGITGYLDVFDQPHYTMFCFFLDASLSVFHGCSSYNQGD